MISKCQSKRTLLQRKYLESQGIPWLSCYSWEQRKLGDLGSVSMCRRIFKHQTSESGEIPFFKIGTFGGEPDAFITRELFEEFKAKYPYPDKGDILISASGSIGRTVEFTGENEYFQDSNIVWLKHDKSIINPFLRHLYSVVEWAGIEGSTIKRLYNDNILKTEVMLPSVQEQTKIAEMLDGIDSLITLHQCKYLMFPAFSQINKSLSDTLSWEQRKVGEVSKRVIVGLATSVTPYYREEGVPILRNLNIKENYLDDTDILFLDRPYAESQVSKQIHAGDVLTVHTGYIGISCVVPEKYDNCLTFTTLITTTDDAVLEGAFLAQYLNSEIGMSAVQAVTTQGGRQNLNTNDFVKVEIRYPSLAEQSKICAVLSRIDNLITLHQREQIFINLEVHDVRSGKKHRFIL